MKTAIYIADDIFNSAENLAKHLDISRSELYSRAIKEYIKDLESEDITQQLNAVYEAGDNDSKVDTLLYRAQLNTIDKEEW